MAGGLRVFLHELRGQTLQRGSNRPLCESLSLYNLQYIQSPINKPLIINQQVIADSDCWTLCWTPHGFPSFERL